MSDPVRDKSTFLCMYMSNHPDTLVSYVRHWGGVKEKVESAKMTLIDSKGMNLTYTTKAGTKEVRVPFEPPLSGYEEVKPRLLQMKVDAEDALGMSKSPEILDYKFPRGAIHTGLAVALLVYTTFAPSPSSPAYGPIWAPAKFLRDTVPHWFIAASWYFAFIAHGSEAVYSYILCRRHKTPFVPTMLYILTTLVFGYPSWVDYRKRVQAARIDSILKGK